MSVVQVGNERASEPGEIVHMFVRYLAGNCDGAHTPDGVGFNKIHAKFGHELSLMPYEALTPRQIWAARKMLNTYKNTQLASFWPAIPEIPEPPRSSNELMKERQFTEWRQRREPDYVPEPRYRKMSLVKIGDKSFIALEQNYDPDIIEKIKMLPERHWDKASKKWLIPIRLDAVEGMADFVAEEGYEMSADVATAISKEIDSIGDIIRLSHAHEDMGLDDIEMPNGLALYPFQRVGVEFIKRKQRVLVADQMGLGKTPQSLIGTRELNGFPLVVICPASLKFNWKREANMWLPGKTVAVLDTKLIAPLRWPDGKPAFDIVILNYDILSRWKDHIIDLLNGRPDDHEGDTYGTICLDECHAIKNPNAQRTQHVEDIITECPNTNRLFVSGSPVVNRPMEFWTLIKLLGYSHEMGGFSSYKALYDTNIRSRLEQLNARARSHFMVRRLKKDVLKDLPEKRGVVVELPITNRKEYDEAEANVAKYFAEQKVKKMQINDVVIEASMAAIEAGLFGEDALEFVRDEVQLATGEVYSTAFNIAARSEQLLRWEALKQLSVKGKMKAVFEWIDEFLESGEKLVVFATHTEVVEAIAKRYNAPYIHGGIAAHRRLPLVDRFQQDPQTKVIVGNIKAMGEGLTLTAASDVAFVEFGWNPKDQDQAEDRCHRIGQRGSVMVWNLVGEGTIDHEIAELIEEKRLVTEAIQDGVGMEKQQEIMDALRDRLLARRGQA